MIKYLYSTSVFNILLLLRLLRVAIKLGHNFLSDFSCRLLVCRHQPHLCCSLEDVVSDPEYADYGSLLNLEAPLEVFKLLFKKIRVVDPVDTTVLMQFRVFRLGSHGPLRLARILTTSASSGDQVSRF